jgi:hypothetical protein
LSHALAYVQLSRVKCLDHISILQLFDPDAHVVTVFHGACRVITFNSNRESVGVEHWYIYPLGVEELRRCDHDDATILRGIGIRRDDMNSRRQGHHQADLFRIKDQIFPSNQHLPRRRYSNVNINYNLTGLIHSFNTRHDLRNTYTSAISTVQINKSKCI